MKTAIKILKEYYSTMLLIGIAVYIHNWFSLIGFVLLIFAEVRANLLAKYLEEAEQEFEKWHKKYIELKYGTN